ncbi:hypothetical protein ACFY0B_43455 [Streptomyces sp. NPDC001797]|uniref:hypothetical protein n=1 Tax=Streptomyces sp. NPDC001797 TaxID=3364610 RepID=UPI0036B73747
MRSATWWADRIGLVVISAEQLASQICPGLDGEIWKLVAGLIRLVRPYGSVTV